MLANRFVAAGLRRVRARPRVASSRSLVPRREQRPDPRARDGRRRARCRGSPRATCRRLTSSTTRSPSRSRAADGPTVVTVHDLQHHDLPQFFSRAERAYRRWAYDGAARSATMVVTVSEYTRAARRRASGDRAGARRGGPARPRCRPVHARRRRRRGAARARSTCRSASSCTRRTCGRTRTTSASSTRWPCSASADVTLVLTGQPWDRLERAHGPRGAGGRRGARASHRATSSRARCPRSIAPPTR